MLCNLPRDLEEKILSRVHVTSLRRLRSTCKQWYHQELFKDPRFTKTHFDKVTKEYHALMLMDYGVYSMRSNLNGRHSTNFSWLFKYHVSRIGNTEVDISQAFHCDGMLLCTTKDNRFMVWNLFSGQTRWIQRRNHLPNRFELYALGYDNKELCRTYKILRFIDIGNRTLEIYEFSSSSWRNLDVTRVGLLQSRGVSLKGNTYWVSIRRGVNEYFLLKFDFSTERFQYLSLPIQGARNIYATALSVVREERLSLLYLSPQTQKMEVWVTNEIETTFVSWSKFLTVDSNPSLYVFSRDMSFFIDEEKKVVFCSFRDKETCKVYIVREDGYKVSLSFRSGLECWPVVFGYVPRLV